MKFSACWWRTALAVTTMELEWEVYNDAEGPFFTRDAYDKYSLAPNIREMWASLHSCAESVDVPTRASCSSSGEKTLKFKDSRCVSRREPSWHSCDSDDPGDAAEGEEDCEDPKNCGEKLKQTESEADPAYPEPRLPYPCMSRLSSADHRKYLDFLMKKTTRDPPQNLKQRVHDEVTHFMRYLQDVARICADDYNYISQAAMQYSEDYLRGCLECIRTLPQLYRIHEMTSLTGGTFNPGLTLTFEKQLLTLGDVNITDHQIVPADAQLASDYQSVSSENPPAKKAKDMHATISGDRNAEKLCSCYEPHACLTRDALVRLLDNHGPDFREQWELPVWIKLSSGKGSTQKKTVFIDSPLPKTEMTVRERSHVFHKESLELSIKKNEKRKIFQLMTELPPKEEQLSPQSCRRKCVPLEDDGLDFEVDFTDLETFGETSPKKSKKQKKPTEKHDCVKSERTKNSPLSSQTEGLTEPPVVDGISQEDMSSSLTSNDDSIMETTQPDVNDAAEPKTERDSALENDMGSTFCGDSDEEKLIIDDSLSSAVKKQPKSSPVKSDCSSPRKVPKCRRQQKGAKVSGDQLSEILRMQTAMFKSSNDAVKSCPPTPPRPAEPVVHSHPTSLVKPCVSSFLERNQKEDGDTCVVSREPSTVNLNATEHKKILSEDLQASAEDEKDYDAPVEGNLLYKLYSLQDVLLMVRSSVSLSHSRKVNSSQNKFVPVHVLPKLEYQLSYGVECLTSSEACQLQAEALLHSSTASYIAHINAHTSKVALLRKLPDNWKQDLSCGFKPSKSLNILHHLLKKLIGLDEGQYLIAHKAGEPFVTLLKAADGKAGRGSYDLQQVHSSTPPPPASGLLPWVPVDAALVLPFHQKHSRVPCTFPPKQFQKMGQHGPPQSKKGASNQKNQPGTPAKTKKSKQKKCRANKRNQYIKKLVQKSV